MKHTQIIEQFGIFGNKSIYPATQMFYVIQISIFNINRLERKIYDKK